LSESRQAAGAYKQIQAQILDGAPWVFVNSTLLVRATRKNVEGFSWSRPDVLRHGTGCR